MNWSWEATMKSMNCNLGRHGGILLAVLSLVSSASASVVVYDNTGDLPPSGAAGQIGPGRPGFDPARVAGPIANGSTFGVALGGFGAYDEIADEVLLAAGPRIFSSVDVQYFASGLDGDEAVVVSIYKVDGPPTPGSFGFNTPGMPLWSSTVPIGVNGFGTLIAADPAPTVSLPDIIAIGLAPISVDEADNEFWGPLIHDPPNLGQSYLDYWISGYPNPGDPWGFFVVQDINMNFAVRLSTEVIPEPAAWIMQLLAITTVFASCRRSVSKLNSA
jgi:hypothetical protein